MTAPRTSIPAEHVRTLGATRLSRGRCIEINVIQLAGFVTRTVEIVSLLEDGRRYGIRLHNKDGVRVVRDALNAYLDAEGQ
ncbi:MAG TPA: hypothetical protein VE987_10100 [Polyangiaceae bacterium]|nr:hypothetical protein [Polyangiaceae bacterium]